MNYNDNGACVSTKCVKKYMLLFYLNFNVNSKYILFVVEVLLYVCLIQIFDVFSVPTKTLLNNNIKQKF